MHRQIRPLRYKIRTLHQQERVATPGFISEAIEAIEMRAASSLHLICCSLVFDEMVIRKRIQFNGQQILGFVDMAEQIVANEALIFMVTY